MPHVDKRRRNAIVLAAAAPGHRRFVAAWTFALLVALASFLTAFQARAVEVQRVVSPGGIEAWLVEDHTNPIIALELAFRGGSALDPEGKAGLAHMAASTIDEGAGPPDSPAFPGALEQQIERAAGRARRRQYV